MSMIHPERALAARHLVTFVRVENAMDPIHAGVLSALRRNPSILFAQGVLVSAVPPGLDFFPRLAGEKSIHLAGR